MQLRVKALVACSSSKKGVSGTYSEAGTATGWSVQELCLNWCQSGLGWRLCSKAAEMLQGHSPGLILMSPWCRVWCKCTLWKTLSVGKGCLGEETTLEACRELWVVGNAMSYRGEKKKTTKSVAQSRTQWRWEGHCLLHLVSFMWAKNSLFIFRCRRNRTNSSSYTE